MRFSRFRWALGFRFSLVVDGLLVPAATWGFAVDMRRITADRAIVPISYGASPFHQRIFPLNVAGCKNTVKTAFVRLKLQENGYSIQAKPLTIQVIPHNYTAFHTA